ncbi:hypothetical protein HET69_35950 [Streptomyces sp. CJ_13]|uniref:hypothetical protein n=1 Tax=Streptomyces sp. CJ_13 TaxID=2724943 RepID=UPI001BDD6D4A|nr:hypothetical protein [Streptomyces sp. CJ_13]MBT1189238.1 hypothetical protein [Streptomyces sp. CJ_13]
MQSATGTVASWMLCGLRKVDGSRAGKPTGRPAVPYLGQGHAPARYRSPATSVLVEDVAVFISDWTGEDPEVGTFTLRVFEFIELHSPDVPEFSGSPVPWRSIWILFPCYTLGAGGVLLLAFGALLWDRVVPKVRCCGPVPEVKEGVP